MQKTKRFWISPSEAVFFVSVVLFIIGTVNIFSASFVLGVELFQDSYFFVKRHLVSFVAGFMAMFILTKLDYRRITFHWHMLMLLACITLLVMVSVSGVEVNGARRWLQIGSVKFQPSEFAKLVVVLVTSFYLGSKIDRRRRVSLKSWPLAVTFLVGFLVLKQPDMGTAAIIVGLGLFLYFLAGIPWKETFFLIAAGAGMIVYLVYNAAYRAERIVAWLDPWTYQQTSGYQAIQSLLAIGSGGFGGVGLGMGASKFHYLPEAHTDFAFAVLCQELGFLGALIIFVLLGMFCWYGFKIALAAPDSYGTILAAGLTVLIAGQAIGNIAMVSGVVPVTGVPMPFVSFGGTSLIVSMTAVGLLINVGRRSAPRHRRETTASPDFPTPDRRAKLRLAKR